MVEVTREHILDWPDFLYLQYRKHWCRDNPLEEFIHNWSERLNLQNITDWRGYDLMEKVLSKYALSRFSGMIG